MGDCKHYFSGGAFIRVTCMMCNATESRSINYTDQKLDDLESENAKLKAESTVRLQAWESATREIEKLNSSIAKYREIFKWLLGESGEFPESIPRKRYGFRTELRKRLEALEGSK